MKNNIMQKIFRNGFLKGFAKAALVSFLFYRSVSVVLLIGCGYGIYNIFVEKKNFQKKQAYEITIQFREGLQGIASALGAGYSIENSFEEARKDLILLYGDDSLLSKEFRWVSQQLSLNRPVEKVLFEFAKRWNTEDIMHFAQVFQTAKKTGGDLIAITRSTAEKISEKIEIKREIYTMIAGKKMEGKIMNLIPLGMIVYFWICSPGFLDCMYDMVSGRIVMTVLMITYVIAYKWSDRISDIPV